MRSLIKKIKNLYKGNGFLYLLLLPALIFIIVFTVYPIIYNFIISFQDVNAMTLSSPNRNFVGLQNYKDIIFDSTFLVVIKNSMVFTFGSVLIQFIIGFSLALFLSKDFKFNKVVRGTIVIGWVIPPVVVGTIWRWILNSDYGLLNFILQNMNLITNDIAWLPNPSTAMIGVLIANIWFGVPFNMMLLLGGLTGIPQTIYEAADIDGANFFHKLFYLTIPMLKQTIAATLMLGIIYTFKSFAVIWVMTGAGPVNATNVLPTWAYQLSFTFFEFSQGATVASIMFVIMFVFSVFYIKYTIKEVT